MCPDMRNAACKALQGWDGGYGNLVTRCRVEVLGPRTPFESLGHPVDRALHVGHPRNVIHVRKDDHLPPMLSTRKEYAK